MSYGAKKRAKDGIHKVEAGDTISSIGAFYGITDWEAKIWNAGENAKLKQERVNPNTLAPGDEVFIPELTQKQEGRPVDAWHDFHVVRNKRFLRLKLTDEDDKPIKNKPYEIRPLPTFRGVFVQQGTTTDGEGMINEEIPHTLLHADLILPDNGLHVRLNIGYLQPLPMGEPIKGPSLDVAGSLTGALGGGDLLGAAKGALRAATGALSGGAGGLAGAAAGLAGGAMGSGSGGMSLSAGGGGLSGGLGGGGGLAGAASGAAGLAGAVAGQAKGALTAGAKTLMASATAMAGPYASAVGKALGSASFGSESDPNIYPAAQRLHSMGFNPGLPKNNKRTAQFSAALMAFQTWCKNQGTMAKGAGGPLGGMTDPGGMLGGGGGALGSIASAVAGPALAAVGLTAQLDKETIDALKKTHGC